MKKKLFEYWEKLAGFLWGLWDIVVLFCWAVPMGIALLFKIGVEQTKKKGDSLWNDCAKKAWDLDKKLTPEQRQNLWDTSFVDGAEDLREEKKLRKRAAKQGVTLGVLVKEWYSDDPEFDGYREYDRQNPDRFEVKYDKNLNRI